MPPRNCLVVPSSRFLVLQPPHSRVFVSTGGRCLPGALPIDATSPILVTVFRGRGVRSLVALASRGGVPPPMALLLGLPSSLAVLDVTGMAVSHPLILCFNQRQHFRGAALDAGPGPHSTLWAAYQLNLRVREGQSAGRQPRPKEELQTRGPLHVEHYITSPRAPCRPPPSTATRSAAALPRTAACVAVWLLGW